MTTIDQTTEKLFGNYKILGQIGTTALATVYRALSPNGTEVSLKVPIAYFRLEPDLFENFQKVITAVQQLRHPNIIAIHGLERDGESFGIVSEFSSIPSLKARKDAILPLNEVLHILKEAAAAIDYAHQQEVVHRDIRPSNVFYDRQTGTVKISDFGTSSLVEWGHLLIRSTINTPNPNYARPEQTQGLDPDRQDDIYALGVLAYELLTGETPFSALAPYTVLVRQLTSEPQSPSQRNPALPKEIGDLILRALSRKPDDRFNSCTAMAQALLEAAGPVGITIPEYGSTDTTEPVDSTTDQQPGIIPIEETRVLCPHCGRGNLATALRCRSCWMTIGNQPKISVQEEQEREREYSAHRRRRKRLIRTLVGVVGILGLLFWSYNTIEIRPPLPKPSTMLTSESKQDQWAMVQSNARHTGVASGPTFVPKGITRWEFKANGPILATPVVGNGRVFVATGDGRIVALDETSGNTFWTYELRGPANTSPTIAGQLLYVGQRDGKILAIDANSGELEWSFEANGAIYGSFTVVDGTLYVGSTDHSVYALDAGTGELRWQRSTDNWVIGTPSVANGIVVVGSQDGDLYMLDTSNGTLRNQYGFGAGIDHAAVLVDDIAYVTTRGGRVVAYNFKQKDFPFQKATWSLWFQLWVWRGAPKPPNPPGLVWGIDLGKDNLILSNMASDGDRLFVPSFKGNLRALDTKTHKRMWAVENLGKLRTNPIISGDAVIQITGNREVIGFDKVSGEQLWSIPIGESSLASPVVANGTLYIATTHGSVYALQ